MPAVDAAVEAIQAGLLAIVPTDTVYGLATSPHSEAAVRRLYRAKGRDDVQPTALVAASVELLRELLPGLDGRADALLPGAYTLVVSNPAKRFPWLTGQRREVIGVRVPAVEGVARELLERAGALVATSANLPGGLDPRSLEDVPPELRAAAAAEVDAGVLPGIPSTVLDLTGETPRVLREGAIPAAAALAAALGQLDC